MNAHQKFVCAVSEISEKQGRHRDPSLQAMIEISSADPGNKLLNGRFFKTSIFFASLRLDNLYHKPQ
jgi:hypothetical protein